MILYIDTSSNYLYTGVVENGEIRKEIKKEYGHRLSEVTLPEVVSMFENTGITPRDITKIIVVNGPGSFTGIRIAISIAKVYAWTLKVPITTITSLEAMAVSSEDDTVKVPVIDARREMCYAGIFSKDNEVILKPCYISYKNLQQQLEKIENYKIISNDGEKIQLNKPIIESYNPDIARITEVYKHKKGINPHAVNPDYLKLTEAEESKLI